MFLKFIKNTFLRVFEIKMIKRFQYNVILLFVYFVSL